MAPNFDTHAHLVRSTSDGIVMLALVPLVPVTGAGSGASTSSRSASSASSSAFTCRQVGLLRICEDHMPSAMRCQVWSCPSESVVRTCEIRSNRDMVTAFCLAERLQAPQKVDPMLLEARCLRSEPPHQETTCLLEQLHQRGGHTGPTCAGLVRGRARPDHLPLLIAFSLTCRPIKHPSPGAAPKGAVTQRRPQAEPRA